MAKGNRRRGRRGGRDRQKQQNPARNYVPPKPPQREYPPCSLSGDSIDDIRTALANPENGAPARFDAVYRRMLEQHPPGPGQRLVYIGEGAFALIEEQRNRGRSSFRLVEKMPYEEGRHWADWRRELSPGISRDYMPEPDRIEELYSEEDLRAFPRFDRTGVEYTARQN